jgi:hypothetical protein
MFADRGCIGGIGIGRCGGGIMRDTSTSALASAGGDAQLMDESVVLVLTLLDVAA